LAKQNLTHTIIGLFGEVQWAKPEMPTITENSSDGHWQNLFLPHSSIKRQNFIRQFTSELRGI